MKPALGVTVAICTRNRPESLRQCLSAIPRSPSLREILVIDNASESDSTRAVAAEFRARYLLEQQIGLEFARNAGIGEARGDIVLFTDDDCQPEPGWVEATAAAFQDEEVVGVLGRTTVPSSADHVQREFDSLRRAWPATEVTLSAENVGPFWYRGVLGVGANMAFRRGFLLAGGGFPVSKYSAADDDYMMIHALLSGHRLRYTPRSAVMQNHRTGRLETASRMFEYGFCASRMIWYVGRRHGRLLLGLINQAWILAQNARQVLGSLLRGRLLQASLRSSYMTGLALGALIPSFPSAVEPAPAALGQANL